ncbi:MAG: helix-turn-helix domain-containing protein [Desulfobacterium sp.]|nr:helix-turn-helix domain-containing protein [Desulfobacterium sp.]
MDIEDDQVVFFTATGPVYSFRKNDKFAKRLGQGLLVSLGLANSSELAKALGVNQSTVSRNIQIYRDKGPAGFTDDRLSRPPYKFNKEKQRIVKQLLDKDHTIKAADAEVDVSKGSVNRALKNGTIERKTIRSKQSVAPAGIKGPAARFKEDVSNYGYIYPYTFTEEIGFSGTYPNASALII